MISKKKSKIAVQTWYIYMGEVKYMRGNENVYD
jgi:hypothetical protein